MAKYNRIDEPLRKAKGFSTMNYSIALSDNNKLRTYDKLQKGSNLYIEGQKWFLAEHELEEATETVIFDGAEVQKCKQRSFMQGYFKCAYELGYKLGFGGCAVDKLPVKYVNYAKFLSGYRDGILALENGDIKKR